MIRRALEWFGGSVAVYVVVAACSAAGDNSHDDETASLGGAVGNEDSEGSGSNGNSTGSGSGDGNQTGGGTSITSPVPDADAAEDGQRIINIYRTTAGGLKTPDGYWDTELGARCHFSRRSDGKEYCVPEMEAYGAYTYSDADCTQPIYSVACGNAAPQKVVGILEHATGSCGAAATYEPYHPGSKISPTVIYLKTTPTGDCTEMPPTEGADYYSVGAKYSLNNLVEGTTEHSAQ